MEPINNQLRKVMDSQTFQERYEQMKREILENKGVQQFLADNDQEVNKDMVDRGLVKLYEYTGQQHDCDACPSVVKCQNALKGFIPKLSIIRESIEVEYTPCQQKRMDDERRKAASMISSMHMPKDVLRATIKDLMIDDHSRVNIANRAADFVREFKETGELPQKGFYLYGEFGVGKSFVLGAIANELATLQIKSVVVFVPEFLREMKGSIQDQSLQEKIDFVKKAPVLMLDDLGAETLSSWTRDEILGTIFHYRMAEQLPTFITSNLGYDELEDHLAYNQKGDRDMLKASRIMERIKAVTTPIRMSGQNRRDQK
ncbi:primosomal protein DnaI [Viridibacillus arvi]|uniref:Primosomal protein DnaI n=1 Tax=Viridibacillus arvi TaxID=263475 RepID=A0A0M0LNG3_9BACL|nr:primosomal protein DnaI [Viridibacillus arvi]KOO52437.1 primosomal protein DnaI [Viridibacillus arvi]